MELKRLIEGLETFRITGELHGDVSGVCFAADQCGRDSMFVAISGLKNDGHQFIDEAISRGARFIVHEKELHFDPPITAIQVPDSRIALGIVSRNFFDHPSAGLTLIAVTGTNGKTTISYLLESIFREAGFQCGVLGTINYRYGDKTYAAPNTTPESYEMHRVLRAMADEGVTHVVAEVSSHAIDLKRVDACDFDLGIFTNLTRDHLDYHLTMENYFQAKKRFFSEILTHSAKKYAQKMIINADDPWGRRILKEVSQPGLAYGIENECVIRAISHELSLKGIKARVDLAGESFSIASPLIGKFNLYNILAAVGAAFILQIDPAVIQKGIEKMSNVPGRLEPVDSSAGSSIFVDYAHTDDALRRVLQNLTELKKKKIITVFGCGGNRDRGKRPLMGEAATHYSDLTIITSDNPRMEDPLAIIAEIEQGVDKSQIKKNEIGAFRLNGDARIYMVVPDRRKAIEEAISVAEKDDIILIAGKGHEDYQILGSEKIKFDDRVVVKQILESRS
ncbi:MAG: UDP-N-acetylmuramoyl-L-alanyl-D-glutamate--2,6-diaminopimelate ligase [Smithella sp.]|nr:UDP-N-acetylmuramoyl-L-alanyl-D-glutamate--2,6-diaminopimelate ligase [Smithella sp.]